MAEPVASLGVSESTATYNDSLRQIGKQDKSGETIGISYFSMTGLTLIPLALRLVVLVILFSSIFVTQPLSWILPQAPDLPPWYEQLRTWEMFNVLQWAAVLVIYIAYVAVSVWMNGIFVGQPGMEIHFTKHKKIVRTVKSGDRAIILDPWVRPFAVVSTKPMVLEMPEVAGTTRDNITMQHSGSLIVGVKDTYQLLVQGGFTNFLRQITEVYASVIKDEMLKVPARDFNKFLIESVTIPGGTSESITTKLELLNKSDLSVDLLTNLSDIDEINVSEFNLAESSNPKRRAIIPRLQVLATTYGIEILDYLPAANMIGSDNDSKYLLNLALPLVSSITRLRQATDTLKEIIEEEIQEEVTASVADKQLGALKIEKIIKEIEAITANLQRDETADSITVAKEAAMQNAAEGLRISTLSRIESIKATLEAKTVDTTSIELYVSELDRVLDALEDNVGSLVPVIRNMVVTELSEKTMVPQMDILDLYLNRTGTIAVLESLAARMHGSDSEALAGELQVIEKQIESIRIEDDLARIQTELDAVTSTSGASHERYSPESVRKLIEQIAESADVRMSDDKRESATA
jgi:hypothetical protein